MALMDAGIPLREHVAGVSVGLVSEVDPSTGLIKDYRILTDILGLEDHLGDMDFKIAGTRKGVTAIQLDIKPAGIPLDIICESLEHARKGRVLILDHMEREINAPRAQDDKNSPRIVHFRFSNDALRRLVGPLGALKRKIEEETGAKMSVGDGILTVVAKNQDVMEKAQEKIDFIIGREIEVGRIYKGMVTSIKEYGAFVEFNGGQQGLLHISELSHEPVSKVSDVVAVGQQLSLVCIGQDVRGNVKLSLKATSFQKDSKSNNVDDGSIAAVKEFHTVLASGSIVSDAQDEQKLAADVLPDDGSGANPSTSSVPAFLIRSASECDQGENAVDLSHNPRGASKTLKASKLAGKQKTNQSQNGDVDALDTAGVNDKKAEARFSTSAKKLKIGTKVTAKVFQVRQHGLVLDLGGGVRGMYRFEKDGKNDFHKGDELLVKCTSFNEKAIPVMSLVHDE